MVGAGTARIEGYRPADLPTVVVSRSGRVPEGLRAAAPGRVLLATCRAADALDEAREMLGADNVLVLGGHRVDLAELKARLAERGFAHLLCEGGPHLLRDLLDQGRRRARRDASYPASSPACIPASPTVRRSTYRSRCRPSWRSTAPF